MNPVRDTPEFTTKQDKNNEILAVKEKLYRNPWITEKNKELYYLNHLCKVTGCSTRFRTYRSTRSNKYK